MPGELELVFINATSYVPDSQHIEGALKQTLRRLAAAPIGLQHPDPVGRLVTEIVFVGDQRIQSLNATFRGVETPTDVLSFERPDTNPDLPASIVISVDTARRQAARAGWSVEEEIASLANHGFLHILGYTHS